MISVAPGTKVFLACRPVDLRNGFDDLAAKAQQMIGADPFSCAYQLRHPGVLTMEAVEPWD